MTFEEKRELYKAISQMLADAGINQTTLKEMAQQEVSKKAEKAVLQEIQKMDAEINGNSIAKMLRSKINNFLDGYDTIGSISLRNIVKEELSKRIICIKAEKVANDDE
jgi:hypothetical protein